MLRRYHDRDPGLPRYHRFHLPGLHKGAPLLDRAPERLDHRRDLHWAVHGSVVSDRDRLSLPHRRQRLPVWHGTRPGDRYPLRQSRHRDRPRHAGPAVHQAAHRRPPAKRHGQGDTTRDIRAAGLQDRPVCAAHSDSLWPSEHYFCSTYLGAFFTYKSVRDIPTRSSR